MDDDLEPTQETKQEHENPVPKRSMWDRLLQKDAQPEPSIPDAADDEPGTDDEADQRAIEDEFWNKK